MHTASDALARTIVPTLRYRDVTAAVEWLCHAFGFERHVVVNGIDGSAEYAELTFGDGMIMLGPVEDSPIGRLMTQPEQAGGAETQICYLFVDDVAAHCDRAEAAGAEIMLDIEDKRSGRGYSCRDPEGHIWNFGTYDPWRHQAEGLRHTGVGKIVNGALRRLALGIGFLALTFAAAVGVAWLLALVEPHVLAASEAIRGEEKPQPQAVQRGSRELGELREQLLKERSAREGAERVAREAVERLASRQRERSLDAQADMARERAALASAERIAQETRERLALVERAAGRTREQLDAERASRLDAERASKAATEQLAKERVSREAAERTSRALRGRLGRRRALRARFRRRLAVQSTPAFLWQ